MDTVPNTAARVTPWNKGKLLGQKPPLKLKEIWAIQIRWVGSIGLDPAVYGTHSLRRTKPTLIYRRTKNLRVVQLDQASIRSHSRYRSCLRRQTGLLDSRNPPARQEQSSSPGMSLPASEIHV